jgi:PhnB protein
MSVLAINPYLILGGKARRAVDLYTRVFGAKVQDLKTFGDMDESCPGAQRDLVMHAELRIGDHALLLSDGGPSDATAATNGPISIALQLNDEKEARRFFAGLAETGKVTQELISAPWGALFGMVVDEFGFNWMFNCELPK